MQSARRMSSFSRVLTLVLCGVLMHIGSVNSQSYLQCYGVIRKRLEPTLNDDFQVVRPVVLVKGKPLKNTSRALSDTYETLNSTDLFGKIGYNTSTVCEYHFRIKTAIRLKFHSIHLDQFPNDSPGGMVSFVDCQSAAQPHRRNRDFIQLNVKFPNGKSNVFCGRPGRKVTRRINITDLPPGQSELVITFWSDTSYVGKGFFGIVRGY